MQLKKKFFWIRFSFEALDIEDDMLLLKSRILKGRNVISMM